MTTAVKNTADVIVVGAGHNGMVSAAYLAQAGLDVLVVEASPTIGGMTSTNPFEPEAPGYTINEASMQASLFRTTTIDKDLGLSSKFGLRQTVIDPAHVQLNYDGTSLALWRDPRRTADELRYFSPSDAEALIDLYRVIDAAVEIGLPLMQTSPVTPDIKKVLQAAKGMAKNRKELAAIGRWMASSQVEAIEDSFESDAIRAPLTIALPFMPFDADLSGWSLIYLGVLSKYGVSMFHGGTGAFPAALAKSVKSHGGRIRTNAPVEQLLVHNGKVTGVRLRGGEELLARRAVLTACSPKTTLTRLLPDGVLPRVLKNKAEKIPTRRRGIADYKLNVALSGTISMEKHEKWRGDGIDLRLGCNSFNTYQESLDAAKACVRGDVPDHIPGLGHATTAFDKGFAPDGCDIFWFWTGLTPTDPRIGWDEAKKQITERVINDASHYYQGIESLEVARRDLALPDIEERFWAIDGSVYHVDPVISRFGPLKPADKFAGYRTPIPGLYLTGAGTHPVAGISGMPGQNAAHTMLKDFRNEDNGSLGDRVRSAALRENTLAARYEKASVASQ
ncbi:phytoene desaturase family protein [Gordonia oryzae]|nr:NAD(P)/FAD-dependent oxidoreductase [Gordonia oryzae]